MSEEAKSNLVELVKSKNRPKDTKTIDTNPIDIKPEDFDIFAGQDLSDANFKNSFLAHTNLKGSKLQNANLQNANLQCSDLKDVTWKGADVNRTDFTNA